MLHKDEYFPGSRGRKIYTRTWHSRETPRAVFLLVHGLGEHSGRYEGLARHFVDAGWAVVALDHNGHGKSQGVPGFMESIDDFLEDVHALRIATQARFPDSPLFLIGHSLGGLIGSLYLVKHQQGLAGAVLSGSLIRTPDHPGFLQRTLIKLLASVAPKLGLLKLDAAGVSREAEVVRAYEADPLVFHGRMTVGQLREMFAAMDRIQEQAHDISLPVLIMHGEADCMTAPEGSRELHQLVTSKDKTLILYPGLYHEIFNEPERDAVYADVLHWCESRLA